jgi:hypothetical protein
VVEGTYGACFEEWTTRNEMVLWHE